MNVSITVNNRKKDVFESVCDELRMPFRILEEGEENALYSVTYDSPLELFYLGGNAQLAGLWQYEIFEGH